MAAPAGFTYDAVFLTLAEQRRLLDLITRLGYSHDRMRGKVLRRGYAQFGWSYVTQSRKVVAASPLPEFLRDLAVQVRRTVDGAPDFNQCIVTYYPPESGIGWHTDAPQFGDCVAAVSLAASAVLEFRPVGSTADPYRHVVQPGSLYVCRGPARWHYEHRVNQVKETRYSVTFRTVDEVPA